MTGSSDQSPGAAQPPGIDLLGDILGAAPEPVAGGAREELLQDVVRVLGEAMDAAGVDLWTLSPGADDVVCRAAWTHPSGSGRQRGCVGTVIPLAQSGDLRRLFLAGETVERHVDDADIPVTERVALENAGLRSRIDMPLVVGADVVGLVSLTRAGAARRLTAEERARLTRLCELAAQAVRGAELVRAEEERTDKLLGLLGAARTMAASLQVRATVERARAEAAGLLPGVTCETQVLLLQDDGGFVGVRSGSGAGEDPVEYEARATDALARQAVDRRQPEQTRLGAQRGRLVVPLLGESGAIGYLDFVADLPRRFRDKEIELFRLLADQTAVALANARAYRSLESRSATDPLTGLYSRWYFYERLIGETARGRRYRQPLSLVMADVDRFDRLVAERGVAVRDAVLPAIARLLRACLRDKIDVPCRLGQGRFALLLPSTPCVQSGAGLVAERVRRMVEDTGLHDDELGALGRLTMSIGVAGFPQHAEDADELADAADAALRQAVHEGGNRVTFAATGA